MAGIPHTQSYQVKGSFLDLLTDENIKTPAKQNSG